MFLLIIYTVDLLTLVRYLFITKMITNAPKKLRRVVLEVFGGCNYTCQMCPQSAPGRGKWYCRCHVLCDTHPVRVPLSLAVVPAHYLEQLRRPVRRSKCYRQRRPGTAAWEYSGRERRAPNATD